MASPQFSFLTPQGCSTGAGREVFPASTGQSHLIPVLVFGFRVNRLCVGDNQAPSQRAPPSPVGFGLFSPLPALAPASLLPPSIFFFFFFLTNHLIYLVWRRRDLPHQG